MTRFVLRVWERIDMKLHYPKITFHKLHLMQFQWSEKPFSAKVFSSISKLPHKGKEDLLLLNPEVFYQVTLAIFLVFITFLMSFLFSKTPSFWENFRNWQKCVQIYVSLTSLELQKAEISLKSPWIVGFKRPWEEITLKQRYNSSFISLLDDISLLSYLYRR